ncbi:MAG: glycerol-3-phosphate dehydrogenase [Verrucomicrobia bacterium]|nr:glycerol-3-phosphate dehydrogenase [Verrucomicrobiota bacterium]|tara:strand:- start:107 stop:1099 length:993 start_codon:yes stop_codon:yes gene_type:complete
MIKEVSVIGGGSWATAIVKMLTNNAEMTHWWMRDADKANYINKYLHNPRYLSSVQFERDKIKVSNDLTEVISKSKHIVIATPSAFLMDVFGERDNRDLAEKVIFSAVKGIVPEVHQIPAEFFHKRFKTPYDHIGIISGPCHAEEVALERLSYLTLACQNQDHAASMAELLECRYIKTHLSDDLFGTELSAVLKNIYAIASGIFHGLGYGDNFQAVLISNAVQEIERFVDELNPIHRDVKSSAYLGDLLVTAYSQFSRNRTFGNMVGKGYSVMSAQMEMNMTAEGYYAAKSIVKINDKYNVHMPIATAVYRILYEKISPAVEMRILAEQLV